MASDQALEYVNTIDYYINYYDNHNLKNFDFYNFFNSNGIQNHKCFIQIKIDNSLTLYFIKEGISDTPIGLSLIHI